MDVVYRLSDRNCYTRQLLEYIPDNKGHGANMGPIWGRKDPGGPHVGPMNLAIWNLTDYANDLRVDVQYDYNEVSFHQVPHNRHPIALAREDEISYVSSKSGWWSAVLIIVIM